jgi:hypothetical protein
MPTYTWILPQVLQTLENPNFYFTFIHSSTYQFKDFFLSFSVMGVIIFNILFRILKFFWKKFSLALQVKNDADPTRFGSITLDNQSKLYDTSTAI